MRLRHVAIFTLPVNAHVYPLLGVCRELVARGFRVTYVSTERYSDRIRECGGEPIIFEHKDPAAESLFEREWKEVAKQPTNDPSWWSMYASTLYPSILSITVSVLPQVESFYLSNVPDLILYDRSSHAGRILSRRLGVPCAQVVASFAAHNRCLYRENGIGTNPGPMLQFSARLDEFLSRYGFDEKNNLWHAAQLNLHLIPKAFQYHADSFDKRFAFVGACLNRPFTRTWMDHSRGRPIVLVSHLSDPLSGTDTNHFKRFIQALSNVDCHVVLSIGQHIGAEELQMIPTNFEINRDASHLEILPHCSLFVGQGGTGSTLEALYHGVPVILSPVTPFHEEVTYRAIELGVGINLPKTSSLSAIRTTVEAALHSDDLLARVEDLQCLFKQSGGEPMVADEIERFIA